MTVRATLAPRILTADPGDTVTFDVELHNEGPEAQILKLTVKGPAAQYSWVAPDTVTLGPGERGGARVGFRTPRTSLLRAGPLDFQVVVTPMPSAGGAAPAAVVTDGVLDVAVFSSLSATLGPGEPSGNTIHHTLTVSNRGNASVEVDIRADPEPGLVVKAEPSTVAVTPDRPATVAVDVQLRGRPLAGSETRRSFTVVAIPRVGEPVEASSSVVMQPRVGRRAFVTSALVVGIAVLAVLLRLTVLSSDSSSDSTAASGGPTDTGPPSDCPAKDHDDRFGVSGLRPDDIPNLPNTYSFFSVRSDGCTPVRFNPCEPVHYIQNAALAPPTGVADVREAFNKLSAATGIQFVDDGLTDETGRRGASVPDRYPGRWAPILVTWAHMGGPNAAGDIQVVGRGIGVARGEVLVSGMLSLNVDAVTDRDARTPLEGGFGPALGTGVGAIGAKGVTWGRVILHELAHVVGLGHTRDKGAIMYPETAEQTSRPADFREPDLAGLRYLGREAGCLTTPPPA